MSAVKGSSAGVFSAGLAARNPAWVQLLGLCPLLAVSTSIVNALALALASGAVLLGTNLSVSMLRRWIPEFARLPAFVLIIATFTTCAVLLLEAYAFELYLRIALFVQIIVTNCMILARVEAFASRNGPVRAAADALGTAAGFALALLLMGAVREALGHGTLFAGMDLLLGPAAAGWQISLTRETGGLLLALLPPGAFILAGLLLGLGRALTTQRKP
jgi:electron transport complex protein RnfE